MLRKEGPGRLQLRIDFFSPFTIMLNARKHTKESKDPQPTDIAERMIAIQRKNAAYVLHHIHFPALTLQKCL